VSVERIDPTRARVRGGCVHTKGEGQLEVSAVNLYSDVSHELIIENPDGLPDFNGLNGSPCSALHLFQREDGIQGFAVWRSRYANAKAVHF
jgi:hypothetical protein